MLPLSKEEGREPTPADLYKLDKYWRLQGELQKELQKLGDKQSALLGKKFVEQYQQIYETTALKDNLFFGEMDKSAAQQMINQIWCADGKSWSQRVWGNTDKLQQALNDNLLDCLITGKKPSELRKKLMNDFDVSYRRADTVVKTEMAHIQTQAAQQRYKDYGITEVEVLVDADERTCDVCGKLEGKRFPINGKMPVPAHPRCRCCIIPVVEDDLTEENNNDIILQDVFIGKSLGAKAKNYDVMDLETGEIFHFTEGTHLQNVEVFAGKGAKDVFRKAAKYASKFGGNPKDWQHVKAIGWLDTKEGSVRANVHWVQCAGYGKHEFFVKEWLD